jgi:hypothetical protein
MVCSHNVHYCHLLSLEYFMTHLTNTDALHPTAPAALSESLALTPAAPVAPPNTLAELQVRLASWQHWPKERRRIFASNIRTAALIAQTGTLRARGRLDRVRRADIAAAGVPCDIAWLNAHLFRAPAKAYGLAAISFANVISSLRAMLCEAGVTGPAKLPPPPAGSAWYDLLRAFDHDEPCGLGLIRFASWCHQHGIPPADVSPATLPIFEADLRRTILHPDIPGLVSMVAKAWRKAARLIAHWPEGRLAPRRRRQTYTLPVTAFPPSFQDAVKQFTATLAGTNRQGPFRGDGPPSTLRGSTIETRLYCLRQAASALAILRGGTSTITGLADLVEEAALREILLFYWQRAIAARVERGEFASAEEAPREAGVTAQTGGIAATLMMIARYHCKLPPDTITVLRVLAADLQPSRQGCITPKNLERLRQFDDPQTCLALLDLPEMLMQRAETLLRGTTTRSPQPLPAAYLARTAVALTILLHIPLRISNLVGLRLGQHLKFDGSRGGRIFKLALQRHETKNDQALEWSISAETSAFLGRYLKPFRPLLATPGSDWLFPGRGGSKGISIDGLRDHLVCIVADEIGVVINPHLFRALAVRLILKDSPGALEDARQLLGDKTLDVILAHYASLEPAQAAGRYDEVLRRTGIKALHQTMPPPRKPGR